MIVLFEVDNQNVNRLLKRVVENHILFHRSLLIILHFLQISASFIKILYFVSQLRAVMTLLALVERFGYPAATLFSFSGW